MKLLVSFDPIKKNPRNSEFSARELRNIYDKLQGYIRNLLLVDADILTSERIILELLLCSMPKCLQIQFELSTLPKETITDFFDLFNHLVEARETTDMNSYQSNRPKWNQHEHHGNIQQRMSLISRRTNDRQSFATNQQSNAIGARRTCDFCQGSHPTSECTNTKVPIQDRFKFLKDKNVCTYCCRPGHTKYLCEKYKKRMMTCKICLKTSHCTSFHGAIPIYPNKTVRFNQPIQHQAGSTQNNAIVPFNRNFNSK